MALHNDVSASGWNPDNPGRSYGAPPPLDPSVPRFMPNGIYANSMDLQRYQTPPQTIVAPSVFDMAQMQRYITDMMISNNSTYMALDRRNREMYDDIRRLEEVFQNDLQTLQQAVMTKKSEIEVRGPERPMSASPSVSHVSLDAHRVDEMLTVFDKGTVMEACLAEAKDARSDEERRFLLDRASALRNELLEEKVASLPSVSSIPHESHVANYACCGTTFDTLNGLLTHVGNEHKLATALAPVGRDIGGIGGLGTSLNPVEDGHATNVMTTGYGISPASSASIVLNSKGDTKKKSADLTVPTSSVASWRPFAVRQMPAANLTIPNSHTESFSFEFLRQRLDGLEWSPGFYFSAPMLPSNAYWILEAEFEPYLPTAPGEHGAKLTAFFNTTMSTSREAPDEENYMDTPVFIRTAGRSDYQYFGNYSQKRFSDKVSYDTLMDHVPEHVREYWAHQLSDEGRPQWVTTALKEHFWPKPDHVGPLPTDSAIQARASGTATPRDGEVMQEQRVNAALQEYAEDLKAWQKEVDVKFPRLTSANLLKAFTNADADEEPGLRLWWEYLECTKYDAGFYDMLVKMKDLEMTRSGGEVPKRAITPPGDPMRWQQVKNMTAVVHARSMEKTERPKSGKPKAAVPDAPGKAQALVQKTDRGHERSNHSPKRAQAPHQKSHTNTVRPWEKTNGETKEATAAKGWSGDLEAAKEFQEVATKCKNKAGDGKNLMR